MEQITEHWPRDPRPRASALGIPPQYCKGKWFNYGRDAMIEWSISEDLPFRPRIAIADLTCKEVNDFLEQHWDLEYYQTEESLIPNKDSILSLLPKIDAIVLTDFFGSDCTSKIISYINKPFLIDRCQSFPNANTKHSCVYSLRKLLPDKYGEMAAYLYQIEGTPPPPGSPKTKDAWLSESQKTDWQLIYLEEEPDIDKTSIAGSIGWESIQQECTTTAKSIISHSAGASLNIGHSIPTFAIPIKTPSPESLIRKFHSLGIHAYIWPNPPSPSKPNKKCLEFNKNYILLPVPVNTNLTPDILIEFEKTIKNSIYDRME